MRLIDADALIPMMRYATTDSEIGVFPIKIGFDAIVEVINSQPPIEPERKKGEWIDDYDPVNFGEFRYKCSKCGARTVEWADNFCYKCGADMRGEEDDTV